MYLTKNVSIVYHHYELNDDLVVVDENVVVEIDDLKVMGDDRRDDLNRMDVLVAGVFVVENVEVVVVGDDDDEMDDQNDEGKQEVSIVKLLSSMNNVMMIEAKCK